MKDGKNPSVCMLVTNFDAPSGGVQRNSRLLLGELNRRGIDTFVCARNYYNLARREKKDGTHFHRSPVLGGSMAINAVIYLIDSFVWLIRNRKKYDVIHCQQMFGPAMVAAVASFIVKKPILVRVTTVGELGEVKRIREMPFSGIRLRLLRRIAKWVALTAEMKREIETLGVAPENIEIIYNSTDIPAEAAFDEKTRNAYRKKLELEHEKIVVFVGRLSEEKGLDDLVNAWKIVNKKYARAHLLLLGEGGKYRNVESRIRELVSNLELEEVVHFLGHVTNPKDYLLASDAFVLPSRTEGMSNALVEAMACGTAIVTTAVPSMLELCEHDKNALIVSLDSPDELARAFIKLFDEPQTAHELARQARLKAERDLSVETMVSKYLDLYRKML